MPIPMQCGCGKSFRVKDEYAGRKIRCPECKGVLAVAAPMPTSAEDEALDVLLTADPPSSISKRRDPEQDEGHEDRDEQDERVSAKPVPAPKKPLNPVEDISLPRKPRRERGSLGFVVSPTIISGLFMKLIGGGCFFGGWALGIFYPWLLVLFLLGIAAVVRGCMGHED